MSVSVQQADFDAGAEVAALSAGREDVGAVASFVGLVRADKQAGAGADAAPSVRAMSLEHYPGMTEKALQAIVEEARGRWDIHGVRVIHRVGRLVPGDRIVFVAVASAHRGEAFAACEFIMDYLKTRAPFWKKEETAAGGRWVDARESDDHAAGRWDATKQNG
ncbi:MAG: molybdopterin synthase catalytic subunit MoaE [Sulfuritalea sp.]|nr:molybdopterin synthase catalytic subunit MoaE [Sulfuritalea sp.]